MATKANFTDEEWRTLQKGVTGAGMLVSVSDPDFTDSFGEASALAKSLAAEHGSPSPFVRELTDVHGTGLGLTSSKQEVETETRAALSAAVTTLSAKAPEEIDTYRELVLKVATAVAEAKGGVEDTETAAIEAIKGALGAA